MSVSASLLQVVNQSNIPEQGSVGLVSRFGQFYKSVDPGLVKVNVCTETVRVVGKSLSTELSLIHG